MNPIRHGPVEIRLNDDGSFDEILMRDDETGLFAHLEQLDKGLWCFVTGRHWRQANPTGEAAVAVWLQSSRKITATWEKS